MHHLLLQPQPAIQSAPRPEHEHGPARPGIVEPIMHIPHQINKQPIQEDGLVPPEIPLQPLHPNHRLLVDRNRHRRILQPLPLPAAMDQYIVNRARIAEPGPGRIQGIAREMLLPRNQREFRHSGPRFQFLRRSFVAHVAEDKARLRIEGDEDVVPVDGFGPRFVTGRGEIPEDLNVDALEFD